MTFRRNRHSFKRHWHPAGDAVPPDPIITVGPVTVDLSETSTDIAWSLDKAATGQVAYGLTDSYGSTTTLETDFLLSHVQIVSGLTEGTLYHYKVTGTAADGTTYDSGDLTFTTESAGGGAGTFPPTVDPLTYVPMVSAANPAYLGVYADPTFGTEVIRISDNHEERHNYSSRSAWSSDGGLIFLGFGSANRSVRDGRTYAILDADEGGANTYNPYYTEPLLGWGRDGANTGLRHYSVNPSTGVISITKFVNILSLGGYSAMSLTGLQGAQDNLDRYVPYVWKKSNGDHGLGIFDLVSDTIHAERTMGNSGSSLGNLWDNCGVSQTGQWAWFTATPDGTATTQGMWTYPIDLSTGSRRQALNREQHCDWARNAAGQDRFIYWDSNVTSFDPATGTKTVLLANVPGNTHISGRNVFRPGWVYISQSGTGLTNPGGGTVFALDIDDPGAAEVYCHNHHTQALGYSSELHGCPSPDGTKVAFATSWESGGIIYCYVAGMDVSA